MSFNGDVQQPTVQGLITLYELDARRLGADIYRFHGHNDGVIRFRGQDYTPIAITADGLEMRSDGKASTPSLSVADNLNGVQGAISALCRLYDDLAGAKLTITQTLAEYLTSADDANYRQQEWYIEQKTTENPMAGVVEFELSNPVDFAGQKIPVRNITTYCHWAMCGRYRGEECGYTGTKRFTMDGKITDDPSLDACGGTMPDCKLRDNEDSFGGFPAAGLT
ncbi:tail protein [Moraxella bovoculi]|uniref:Tail protein n=1 Tax=Moraxella bovoculi TaxID=386891 RepID=A0AAC8PUE4_9GAMM|nr:phage minor tail protein L [Moraxella bovoculi]AKG07070.1 tail protein [Moraxella bovoculi]AKG07133.1 tail protein [Moraxella bovoculi]AKG14152.1 tail protein [Moraxella bovoculi]